jgi:penicillin amidase
VLARRLATISLAAIVPLVIALAAFLTYIFVGVFSGAGTPSGTLAGLGVEATATVTRDTRGIPHIRARNEHDLYFLDGYEQGTDRLFQLDIYRRLVAGKLAEVFGDQALASDEAARVYDIDAIANAELAALPPAARTNLQAFADGVNAAMRTRPLPPEFRALAYAPQPWTPKDSIVASFATVLALTDGWDDVAARSDVVDEIGPSAPAAFFSITDPKYDSPTTGGPPAPVASLPPLRVAYPSAPAYYAYAFDRSVGLGSNNVVSGSAFTSTHRALLGNDPHLELRIPGVWWLVDLEAPGVHVAGATLAGVPGVVLGHNEHIAWGATNGTVATVRVYRERFRSATSDEYLAAGRWLRAEHRTETFGVRFGKAETRGYLRTRHGFVFEDRGVSKLAAAWTADFDRRSSLEAFDGLDRAPSAGAALAVLARYPGPAQNFVVADDRGNAGYVLAGDIPIDDAWGMRVHDGVTSPWPPSDYVAYARLPHVAAARDAVAFSANDRTYGKGYPYRLTADFAPPYRAWSLARHLKKQPYDVESFSAMQADVFSPPEAELAVEALQAFVRRNQLTDPDMRDAVEAFRTFDGSFTGDSRGAVFVTVLRRAATERLVRLHMRPDVGIRYLQSDDGAAYVALMRALRERPHGWVPNDDYDAFLIASMHDAVAALRTHRAYDDTWDTFGERTALHPLAAFGFSMWNGVRFPGLGDGYALHVQAPANAQSFRAVWDVGNWSAGGIVIPQGESGEPGSSHYRDGAPIWLRGDLVPLPFGDAEVTKAAESTLALAP